MSDNLDNCKLEAEQRWHKIDLELQKIKDNQEVMFQRLNKQANLVSEIQQLSTSVATLANNMNAMLEEQRRQGDRLQTLEQKPAKRWDAIVEKVLMLVVTALVGALLVKLGIS